MQQTRTRTETRAMGGTDDPRSVPVPCDKPGDLGYDLGALLLRRAGKLLRLREQREKAAQQAI